MVKAFFFDLGNVLLFFSTDRMLTQISSITHLSTNDLEDLLFRKRIHADFEEGKISFDDLYTKFLNLSNKNFSKELFEEAAGSIFTINQPVIDLIKELKVKGHTLILLSNTNECHYNYIQKNILRLDSLFDKLILSYEVQSMKPDQKIYFEALKAANCSPSECFYTDDVKENVEAGKKVGLDAELFIDAETLKKQLMQRKCL